MQRSLSWNVGAMKFAGKHRAKFGNNLNEVAQNKNQKLSPANKELAPLLLDRLTP